MLKNVLETKKIKLKSKINRKNKKIISNKKNKFVLNKKIKIKINEILNILKLLSKYQEKNIENRKFVRIKKRISNNKFNNRNTVINNE